MADGGPQDQNIRGAKLVSETLSQAQVDGIVEGTALARDSNDELVLATNNGSPAAGEGNNGFYGVAFSPVNPATLLLGADRFGVRAAFDDTTSVIALDSPVKVSDTVAGSMELWITGVDAADLLVGRVEVLPDATTNKMYIRMGGSN